MSELSVKQIKKLVGKPQKAPEAINALSRLFQKDGVWIKGEESIADKKFCLIGGIHLVNGPSEREVTFAICCAILKTYHKRVGASYKMPSFTKSGALTSLGYSDGSDALDIVLDQSNDSVIPAFNDHKDTTVKHVLRVIEVAKEYLDKLSAIKEQIAMIEEWKVSVAETIAKTFPKKKKKAVVARR